jgi:hypothetical protein
MVEAHKRLKEFKQLWIKGCQEDRQQIMKLVLDRVWVSGKTWLRFDSPQVFDISSQELRDRAGENIEAAQLPPS